ncbi:MAG: Gfo/Idh/MocA family oxidoreductase [Alphaproteobacteria bacterium]|nr:Gfo/Idh/MocA family oxidoreductase [Alphaproteobacteria bacterium]
MRLVVVGMGVQGPKRTAAAGSDVVATVDPEKDGATHRSLRDVALDRYDAAALCVPDDAKLELMEYLARHGKHALVEKPVVGGGARLAALAALARGSGAVFYTAYNHRFEPHFVRMKALLESGELGRIYTLRMFYGNGTARLVRGSRWRDRGSGVLRDLGSHLLDTVLYWLGEPDAPFAATAIGTFENASPDHAVLTSAGRTTIQLEMTLLSWRNHFTCDVLAERGSAHIEGLCKWGPATFRHRRRILPSGRPTEEVVTLDQADPTWDAEYRHFKALCAAGGPGNLDNDIWIGAALARSIGDSAHA